MKQDIHPEVKEVTFSCACGAQIKTVSTLGKDQKVDLCSRCHPFFTGQQRLVDATGRVERFKKKYEKFKTATKTK